MQGQEELVLPSGEPQSAVLKLLGVLKICYILGEKVPVSDGMRKEAVFVGVLVGLDNTGTVRMLMPRKPPDWL